MEKLKEKRAAKEQQKESEDDVQNIESVAEKITEVEKEEEKVIEVEKVVLLIQSKLRRLLKLSSLAQSVWKLARNVQQKMT